MVTVVICSYFEEEYVERIREVDERLRVLYREDLVRVTPRLRWVQASMARPSRGRGCRRAPA